MALERCDENGVCADMEYLVEMWMHAMIFKWKYELSCCAEIKHDWDRTEPVALRCIVLRGRVLFECAQLKA
jgi:hypothetical protein